MTIDHTEADGEYIAANFLTLEELCSGRPETPDEVRALIELRRLPGPSFAPDCDRAGRFGRPPTRDLLVENARERFPDVFAGSVATQVT